MSPLFKYSCWNSLNSSKKWLGGIRNANSFSEFFFKSQTNFSAQQISEAKNVAVIIPTKMTLGLQEKFKRRMEDGRSWH